MANQSYDDDSESALGRAERDVFSMKRQAVPEKRHSTQQTQNTLPHEWEKDPIDHVKRRVPKHIRFATIFFIFAGVFFLVAIAVALYLFYSGGTTVSTNNITISMTGPTTIAAGDTVPLALTITNKNPVAIKDANLEIDFPPGTRSATDISTAEPRYEDNIGTIPAGGTVTQTVKAVLFGSANEAITMPVSLSYGVENSNATFTKKTQYGLTITSSPLSLSVQAPSQVVSGKPVTVVLEVRSNTNIPMQNVLVSGDLPFGFSVASSSIPFQNSSFSLGTLSPGTSKDITLVGILQGQDGEQRSFNFTVGTGSSPGDSIIAIPYMSQSAAVAIMQPFLQTTLSIGGTSADNIVVSPGTTQSATLAYTNTLSTSIQNATIVVQISGSAVDYNSIQTANGFYDSSAHTITFSANTDSSLSSLVPGASGIGSFNFSVLSANAFTTSPQIVFTISLSGTPTGAASTQTVNASVTKVVKVQTNIGLTGIARYSSGPFTNSGPIPPEAGATTTYAIEWQVQNPGNAVAGGTVTATLPTYVTYLSHTSGNGSFAYNSASRTVTWATGDIQQGGSATGYFQISFAPSISQKGLAPTLVMPATFSGYDRFAGVTVTSTSNPVTTENSQDPGYVATEATVE